MGSQNRRATELFDGIPPSYIDLQTLKIIDGSADPVAGMKSAEALDLITMLPLMAAERPQSDIGRPFEIRSDFEPAGDQPEAIQELCDGIAAGERDQVLLGVTGSGKTFTMAHVIQRIQRPAIILAPNKTLAAQLYGEMKSFFPE